ncbi:MAG: histidine phosphatase family protein [Candidatus Acidiferrales bacterium]
MGDELEGRPREDIEMELLFFRENAHLTPPGGESFANFCASRQEAIRNLILAAVQPPYPRMAVVMHASVLLLVRPTIEGRAPNPEKMDAPPPGKILTLVVTPKGVKCEGL